MSEPYTAEQAMMDVEAILADSDWSGVMYDGDALQQITQVLDLYRESLRKS